MTYTSATADPQAVLDEHVLSASTGRCLTCDRQALPHLARLAEDIRRST